MDLITIDKNYLGKEMFPTISEKLSSEAVKMQIRLDLMLTEGKP